MNLPQLIIISFHALRNLKICQYYLSYIENKLSFMRTGKTALDKISRYDKVTTNKAYISFIIPLTLIAINLINNRLEIFIANQFATRRLS